jgi:hypothetical protein
VIKEILFKRERGSFKRDNCWRKNQLSWKCSTWVAAMSCSNEIESFSINNEFQKLKFEVFSFTCLLISREKKLKEILRKMKVCKKLRETDTVNKFM